MGLTPARTPQRPRVCVTLAPHILLCKGQTCFPEAHDSGEERSLPGPWRG